MRWIKIFSNRTFFSIRTSHIQFIYFSYICYSFDCIMPLLSFKHSFSLTPEIYVTLLLRQTSHIIPPLFLIETVYFVRSRKIRSTDSRLKALYTSTNIDTTYSKSKVPSTLVDLLHRDYKHIGTNSMPVRVISPIWRNQTRTSAFDQLVNYHTLC